MELLNPAALWLLLLVLVLLLLPRRPSARARRLVGNLHLWTQPVSRDPMALAMRRVRRNWLVLLQAAVMVTLIVSLARPVLSWRPQHVTLIVDVSASMGALDGDVTRLEQARRALAPVLETLPLNARVRVFAAGAVLSDRGGFARGDPALARTLEQLQSTGAAADLAATIRDARMAAGDEDLLIVATDRSSPDAQSKPLRWLTVGRAAPNVAITALAARRLPGAPDGGDIVATVENYAGSRRDVNVEIAQDGALLERRRLAVEPGKPASFAVRAARLGRVLRARLTNRDALSIDNERYTVVPPRTRHRVVYVGGRNLFLLRAITAHPDLDVQTSPTAPTMLPPNQDMVICDPCATTPPGPAGVLIAVAGRTSVREPEPVTVSLAEHPLARGLVGAQLFATTPDAGSPPDDADVVIRAGGSPAVVAYERQGRRVVELRLDLASTELALSTAFPVLIDNIVAWLARRNEPVTVAAGSPLQWHVAPGTVAPNELEAPAGGRVPVQVAGSLASAISTDDPGIYTDGAALVLAVNPVTAGESELDARPQPIDIPAPSTGATRVRPRAEAATILLLAALALLSAEWWYRGRWTARGQDA